MVVLGTFFAAAVAAAHVVVASATAAAHSATNIFDVSSSSSAAECRADDECVCSYNGVRQKGTNRCSCDDGWRGAHCHQLDLAPAQNGSGLQPLLNGPHRTSSWGGSVLRADDGSWHMYYSEMVRKCGIHTFTRNSVVAHAVSSGPPLWQFNKTQTLFPVFSHTPVAVRAPDTDEYVLFFIHYPGPITDAPTCNCTDGSSSSGKGCADEIGNALWSNMDAYYTTARGPRGPWSEPVRLPKVNDIPGPNGAPPTPVPCRNTTRNQSQGCHNIGGMNLSPVLFENGSAIAWGRWDIFVADHWRDPESWRSTGQAPDFALPPSATDAYGAWEGEDPSLWRDRRGRWHILAHAGARGTFDCGRHQFSKTGAAHTWLVAGGNVTKQPGGDLGGCAYPRENVSFVDGSRRTFYRRERPHLIFDIGGRPIALATGNIDSPFGPQPGPLACHPPDPRCPNRSATGCPVGLYKMNCLCAGATCQRDASYTMVQSLV